MNYAAHNKELHDTLKRPDEPVIFTKADSAILNQGKPFFIPDHLGRIDYETEVVVRICRLGKNISERFAHRYYDALTVGIDFTARDLQKKASEAVKELKAYAKTKLLAPDEAETVVMTVKVDDLVSFDESASAWVVAAGEYQFLVGASSQDIKSVLKANVKGQQTKVNNVMKPQGTMNLLKR